MTPEAFRAWRTRMAWSQDRVAAELDVSRRTVGAWERGESPVPRPVELATRWLDVRKGLLAFRAILDGPDVPPLD